MARLNIQKAREAGYSDEEIQTYISKRPDVVVTGLIPTQAPQQQGGVLNRLADWLPVAGAIGGSFIPGAGNIVGGALGAGTGAVLKQLVKGEEFNPGEIGKEAAFGGIGGVVGKVASPIFKGASQLVGRATGKVGEAVVDKAAQSVLNTGRSQFQKAAEVGVNLNKAFVKHSPFLGNSFDEMIGPIGKKIAPELKGGNIAKRIKLFENEIGDVVSEAGSTTKISGDEVIKALRTELRAEKAVLGNDVRVKVLEGLVKEAEKSYANGTTVAKALNKLRIANRQFGRSILEDQTGSMISSAQKLEANVLRNKLKTLFPTIGNALDNEQELIILREVLSGARAKTQAGALGVSGLDITKPGTILQFLLGSPRVGGKIASLGAKGATEAGAQTSTKGLPLKEIGGQAAAQVGTRAVLDQPQTQGAKEAGTFEATPSETSPLQDFDTGKQQKVKQAFLRAMLENPKQADTLKKIYDFGFSGGGQAGENVGKVTAKDYGLAKSGLKNVEDVRRLYKEDPNALTKQLVPGQFFSRKFDSALYDAADTLLRLRTGAQANPTEIRGYMKKIGPSFGDSKEVVEYKLAKLESDLRAYLQGGTSSSTLQDFGL